MSLVLQQACLGGVQSRLGRAPNLKASPAIRTGTQAAPAEKPSGSRCAIRVLGNMAAVILSVSDRGREDLSRAKVLQDE
jgi:hypothetical protein